MANENRTRRQTIKGYKRHKLSVLHQLGIHVGKEIFEKATTEIQVDNIARSLILRQKSSNNQQGIGKERYKYESGDKSSNHQ